MSQIQLSNPRYEVRAPDSDGEVCISYYDNDDKEVEIYLNKEDLQELLTLFGY